MGRGSFALGQSFELFEVAQAARKDFWQRFRLAKIRQISKLEQ
jgi:hypothetical protein